MTTHAQISPVFHGADDSEAQLAVLGVHGRTQSPEFLIELSDRLGLGGISWTLPAAAENSWYPGKFMEEHDTNQPQLDEALSVIETQLGHLLQKRDAGGPPVVVFGFSQGACLLAEHLLRNRPNVDGVILHTGGYLGPGDFPPTNGPNRLGDTAIELFCADEDPWVPLYRAKDTAALFEQLAESVTFTTYRDAEHHINDDAIRRMRGYLSEVIAS